MIRRSALPSVIPKPRSSGSAEMTADRPGIAPGLQVELAGLDESLPVFVRERCGHRLVSIPAGRAGALVSIGCCNHTRRRFGGRQPLCGIGVTSRIDVIVKPAA